MAYVNVKDWSVDQVTDWLKGIINNISYFFHLTLDDNIY